MSQLLFYTDDYETMLSFYADIVSSSLFQNPCSFLQKYPESVLTNYSVVVYCESLAKDLVREVVKANAQKLNQVKQKIAKHLQQTIKENQVMTEQQITAIVNSFSQSIFNRFEEIKTIYLLESISLGSLYLQDVNWKVTKTISSSAKSFVGLKHPYIFTLTLYLRQANPISDCQSLRPVTLEMTKLQLKQFLTQLKTIKSQLA